MTTPDTLAAAERYRKHLEAKYENESPYRYENSRGHLETTYALLHADEALLARAYVERKPINGREFARNWYREEEIERSVDRNQNKYLRGDNPKIPRDVTSREFAVWLTEQYRLAMAKGIDIGQRGEA